MRPIFKKILTNKYFYIYLLIANILFACSNLPMIYRWLRIPASSVFYFAHFDWVHDYNLYLSVVTQGLNGFSLHRDAFTSENTIPSVIYISYLIFGKIFSIFQLSPQYIYHIFRILSVEFLFVSIYLLIFFLYRKMPTGKKVFFSIFCILIPTTPVLFLTWLLHEKLFASLDIPWWVFLDPLERLNGLPHYIIAQALSVMSVIFIFSFFKRLKWNLLLASVILLILSGLTLPSAVLMILVSLPLAFIYSVIRNIIFKKKCIPIPHARYILILVSAALVGPLLTRIQELQGYPWDFFTPWLFGRWNTSEVFFNQHLVLAFGFILILTLPAIVKILYAEDFFHIFVVFWALVPFVTLPVVDLLRIPKIHLLNSLWYLPFGILLIYSYNHFFTKNSISKIIRITCLLGILAVSFTNSYKILAGRLNIIRNENTDINTFYITNNDMEAIKYINANIAKNTIILSKERMGSTIPAFVPVKSYLAHMTFTKDFFKKQVSVNNFYSQKISVKEAANFLKSNNISYVYFGREENNWRNLDPLESKLDYPFLEDFYHNNGVIFYRVKLQ